MRTLYLSVVVVAIFGCDSAATKSPSPATPGKAAASANADTPVFNLDAVPVEPITIEEFFKEKAVAKYVDKRVTWKFVIENVSPFHNGGIATGFPVEFEGLKEPVQGTEGIGAFSNKYNEYAKKEIARVGQTVEMRFDDEESHSKLKDAKGKRATVSGIVAESPIKDSADLKHCRVISIDN